MPLPDTEAAARAWLHLLRAPQLGGSRIRSLLEVFGSAERIVAATDALLRRHGAPDAAVEYLSNAEAGLLQSDLDWLKEPAHSLLTCDSADYPELLRRTPQAPAALFVIGNPDLLWHPQVAIVGSRNPTEGGRDNARDFSRTLARSGLVVTSGLADGIDAVAHRAALEIGAPTIAVVGTGPDIVYPPKHRSLAQEIAASGAIVSEFPPGTEARREHFPRRNRVIAGLSLGTLVVEAALQSGALITARLAAEAGREVFALPGSIHNPLAKGCHRLIREGAALIETTGEIVDALATQAGHLAQALRGRLQPEHDESISPRTQSSVAEPDPDYQRLWAALDFAPAGIDLLAERSGLTVESLSSMLLLMELDGRVSAAHGRYAKRRS